MKISISISSMIILLVFLVVVSCNDKNIIGDDPVPVIMDTLEVKFDFSIIDENNIELSEIQINLVNDSISYEYTASIFSDSVYICNIVVLPGLYDVYINLLNQDEIAYTDHSTGIIDETQKNTISVFFRNGMIEPKMFVLWAIETNRLYNYEITPNTDIKQYEIENIDDIINNYLNDGMQFIWETSISWSLLDSNMVPITHYSFGDYRNPVSICNVAHAFYREYLQNNDPLYLQGFLNNVDWLCNNCDENYYVHYEFRFTHFAGVYLEPGWISGMAQGEILSTVSRAYNLTGDTMYLNFAENFFKTMYSNSSTEWSVLIDHHDYYWTEEYPNDDCCHVLNGFMLGLWGLWDYYIISGDEFALKLFKGGIRTLSDNYLLWDIDGEDGSGYCLHWDHTVQTYHPIHLILFNDFAEFFNIPEFYDAVECYMD